MPHLPNAQIASSVIGVGCAYLTAGSPTRHEHRLISAALDAGATHFDVAPQYGLGTAERILGEALQRNRNRVTIATKVGILRPTVGQYKLVARALLSPFRNYLRNGRAQANRRAPVMVNPGRQLDHSAGRIRVSIEESLRALRTDWVDLYLLHMPRRTDVTEEAIAALIATKESGKARAIGLATDRDETVAILSKWPNVFDVVQYSWSVLDAPLSVATEGNEPFRITHRALARAFTPLYDWLSAEPIRRERLSLLCNVDLSDPATLSRALIGASLVENRSGISLVASHSIGRTRSNVETALDSGTAKLGEVFLAGLRCEDSLPGPAGT